MMNENANIAVKAKSMKVEKTQSLTQTKSADSTVTSSSVVDFIADVKAEFKKINWTSPEELKAYTKIVVGATFFLGMGIYCTDLVIQTFLSGLNVLIRWIT